MPPVLALSACGARHFLLVGSLQKTSRAAYGLPLADYGMDFKGITADSFLLKKAGAI